MDHIYVFFKKNKKFSIILSFFLVVIIILLFLSFKPKESNYKIFLFGFENITLNYGEEYVEPGFYAINSNGEKITNKVVVTNNIDIYKPGIYKVSYVVDNQRVERIVKVLEDKNSTIYLSLLGDNVVELSLNEKYVEPGFKTWNKENESLNDKVKITGEVDISKEGIYTLKYILKIGNKEKIATRTIKVINKNLNLLLNLNNYNYINANVIISAEVLGSEFSYIILPNKVVKYDNKVSFEVKKNGVYKFVAYNKEGIAFENEIEVSNIDKTSPKGTCLATLYTYSTNISVNATDESGIEKYVYMDNSRELKTVKTNLQILNQKLSKNISVKVYDKASNYSIINCQINDKSYFEPIKPNSSENVIKQNETETLKVYISKKGSYYLTRIWAYNPYLQLNKFDSPEYGKNLYRPNQLLEKAVDSHLLENKLVLGFNASGFYLRNVFDADSVSKYSAYNKTSVGTLVITNGKVIRNAYNKAFKTWFTIGVDRDNELRLFKDLKGTSASQIEEKKKWSQNVIDSGIRNTFTFASPLVENGVKSDITTSMPKLSKSSNRQAICQINKNNFVLITGNNLSRNNLIDIMLSLNCKTGTNLDGGGSIALLYKEKNSKNIEVIIGNTTSLAEVGYFTE